MCRARSMGNSLKPTLIPPQSGEKCNAVQCNTDTISQTDLICCSLSLFEKQSETQAGKGDEGHMILPDQVVQAPH